MGDLNIYVALQRSGLAEELRCVRAWLSKGADSYCKSVIDNIVPCTGDLHVSIEGVETSPSRSILVTFGYDPLYVRSLLRRSAEGYEAIIVDRSAPRTQPRADLFEANSYTSVHPDQLWDALRKSAIRQMARRFAIVRPLASKDELVAAFRLRYSVWKRLSYLPTHKESATGLELDYTDRTSLPIGLFNKQGGALIGCARIVNEIGADDAFYVRLLEQIVKERDDTTLAGNLGYPVRFIHPFDVLEAFDQFQDYYRALIVNEIRKAELSRVIVDDTFRQQRLGEVLVDSACGYAKRSYISRLFLACKDGHEPFYGRCGFKKIDGLVSDHFFNIQAACIAMEQHLTNPRRP